MDPVCSQEIASKVILAQVSGAKEDKPEVKDNDKDIAGQRISAAESDKHYLQNLGRKLAQYAVTRTNMNDFFKTH